MDTLAHVQLGLLEQIVHLTSMTVSQALVIKERAL